MRRLLGLVVLAGGLLATFAILQSAQPGWWERLWYPLRYETSSAAMHATTTSIRPCSPR